MSPAKIVCIAGKPNSSELATTIYGLNSACQVVTLVALGFERSTMTFRSGIVIAHTHHLVYGIESAFTRCGVAFRFSVLA
jgi:hypothetical protein